MSPTISSSTREIALPVSGLTAFRTALKDEAGPLAAVHALHAAGFASGADVLEGVTGGSENAAAALSSGSFWRRLGEWFEARGWGTLTFESLHPGVGCLRSPDWAEAEGEKELQPSCAFTTGLLSSILTLAAGGAIAVLETSCRARGDDECTWIFGSEATVQKLYTTLLEGRSFDDAVAEL
jgi:hypothetical protein